MTFHLITIMRKKLTIANQNTAGPMDDGGAAPDHVQPFMLEASNLRGRIVRLPTVLNHILQAHAYPTPIAQLLAEALCLTTLLAGMLKFDGIFTLQAKGLGPVTSLVCDMTNDGILRGTVTYDSDTLGSKNSFSELMGLHHGQHGYLCFTVDQAQSDDRTQGIVGLDGDTLTACVRNYFLQSEQVDTSLICFVDQDVSGHWNGGAIMVQNLARQGGIDGTSTQDTEVTQEDWQRALTLMHSVSDREILDNKLPLNTVLYRLFHEEGVRVFDPIAIRQGCRCSREKIDSILNNLSQEEKIEYSDNGVITVTCEFCSTHYHFSIET